MNIVLTAAYRTYQTIFKLAIPLLPYRSPKVLNNMLDIPALLREKKIERILLVTDAFLHGTGMLDPLKKALSEQGICCTIYDKTIPNPTIANVEEARELYCAHGCQGLIGFGGGSNIDCAKAVGARIARPNRSIRDMKGILKVGRKLPFLIAIPTTAGTGSETTVATVITDGENEHKFPINDFCLIPDVAVLDPEMTRTLPPAMTATTGMDALTHAVEAYIGRSTTKETRRDALEAARLIAENLERAYRDGTDMEARGNMLHAAFLAGRAFTKSYVGYCHAVAHSLGGKYHTPHGLANAVLLPYVLEAYGSAIDRKAKELACAMHLANDNTPERDAARQLIAWIREMNGTMGIPQTLPGIREEHISKLAAYAEKEANPLYPVPVLMTRKELEQFYYHVMEETV